MTEWFDATPERLARAASFDLIADAHDILSPNGFSTGMRYRKIDSPIEVALKRGWIVERQYMAGVKFMETLNSAIRLPRLIGKLEASVDGTRNMAAISDHRLSAQASVRGALAVLPPRYRDPFFNWMFAVLSEDISVASFGAYFSRAQRRDKALEVGKRKLVIVLNHLAKHYGF